MRNMIISRVSDRRCILLYLCIFFSSFLSAQKVSVKTNALSWAALTPNMGVEVALGNKFTTNWHFLYNPWTFSENRKMKLMAVQPELRYWFCERFSGHFMGMHLLGGIYNIGNINADFKFLGTDFGMLKDHRYEGWMAGAGIGYGYQWILSSHWSLEAEIGLGYIYTRSDKFECAACGDRLENNIAHHYWGPTKFALNVMYVF